MNLTPSDLALLRGMSPDQRRQYMEQKLVAGEGGPPPLKGFDPAPVARGTYTPGRYGTYVAANPLEHLMNGLSAAKGIKTTKANNEASQKAYEARQAAGRGLAEAVAGADMEAAQGDDWVHLGNGVMRNNTTGQEVTSEGWREMNDLRHQQALDRVAASVRVPASVKEDIANTSTKIGAGAELISDIEKHPGSYSQIGDLVIDAASNAWTPLGNVIRPFVYDPEEQGVRERGAKWVADIRKALSGANFTAMEKALGAEWDPTAPGINAETAKRRFENLNSYMSSNHANLLGQFGQGQPQQPPQPGSAGLTTDPYAPQAPSAATGPQPMRIKRGGQTLVSYDGGATWAPE